VKRGVLAVFAAVVASGSAIAFAQGGANSAIPCMNDWQRPGGCDAQKGTLKPRDLSGVWQRVKGAGNLTEAATALLTPAGRKIADTYKPSFGPRQVPPAHGNDPLGKCDPLGLTRNLLTEIGARTYEFVHASPERTYQFFEYGHQYRLIWTDGRKLPEDPEPRWMGYSVGRWDGDTFIVNTVGLDARQWADHFGHPIGSKTTIEERYRRTAFDTLEMRIIVTDPELYSKPWDSGILLHRLMVEKGMDERLEMFCVPSEEEAFNEAIRDPAGGVVR
jgi:hypothetical protein